MVGAVGRLCQLHGDLMARTRLVIDADIVEADLQRDPIDVEIPGLGVFTFPGVMSAAAVLRMTRWHDAGVTSPSVQQMLNLLGDLVPDTVLAQMASAGFDVFDERNAPVLGAIISALLDEYASRDAAIAAAGPPPKPQAGPATPPPFYGDGRSSSPTSDAPTDSPFPVT